MPVKGSESYVWFTDQKLGNDGSQTYFGRNKVSGLPCVIKLQKDDSLQKQLDKFKKLNNKNVVKFLTIEFTKHKELVIVFEYCDEQCLLKLLERPENIYGLDDLDVIHLHEAVINGLEALTNIGMPKSYFIKPSNILCVRELTGMVTFKISDYLYAKYETQTNVYFINNIQNTANALVWSLGAVLCHAIMGRNPFMSREQSAEIISLKKEENIFFIDDKWQSSFPPTVQLTTSLKLKFISLITSCMNLRNQIDLKKFFDSKFQSSFSNVMIYVFDPSTLHHTTLVSKSDYDSISRNDLLVFDNKLVTQFSDLELFEKRISQKEPVIFLNYDNNMNLEEYKIILDDAYLNAKKASSDDVSYARHYAGFIIFCLRLNEKIMLSWKGLKQIFNTLADQLDMKMRTIKLKLDVIRLRERSSCQNLIKEFEGLKKGLNEIQVFTASDQDNSAGYSDSGVVVSHDSPLESLPKSYFQAILKELVEKALQTFNCFVQDTSKQLTHNELQVHKYEKVKLKERAKKAYQLLDTQIRSSPDIFVRFKEIIQQKLKSISDAMTTIDQAITGLVQNNHSNDSLNSSGFSSELQIDQKLLIDEINTSIDIIADLVNEFDIILMKIA